MQPQWEDKSPLDPPWAARVLIYVLERFGYPAVVSIALVYYVGLKLDLLVANSAEQLQLLRAMSGLVGGR